MIRLFEMFAGYGTATHSLKELGIDHEVVGFSEIDKYAIQCFEQNHGSKNFGNATKINPDDLPDFDLLTGGFPCQAFSVAGKRLGELDMRGTLFNEVVRIAAAKKPKYMLLENVKGLTTKRHKETFEKILFELERIGYDVYCKILNSKDFGVPQNRERVWFVCFRKDLSKKFEWPKEQELKIFIKDILEKEVDEKYFLSEKTISKIKFDPRIKIRSINGTSGCLSATMEKGVKNRGTQIIQLNKPTHSNNRLYSVDGISPTINAMQGGNRQPFICASRGRYPGKEKSAEQRLEPRFDGVSNSLTSVQKDNYLIDKFILRKLTAKECFRLQGFFKDQIDLEGLSETQKLKLAGNGQTLQVVMAIFREMFK